MVTTQAELEALLKQPEALAEHIAGVAVDKMGAKLDDRVQAAVDKAVLKITGKTTTRPGMGGEGGEPSYLPEQERKHLPPAERKATWLKIAKLAGSIYAQKSDAAAHAVTKTLSVGSGPDGGYLVPEEFRAEIMAMALEESIIRPRATVIPMGSDTLRIPAIDDTSHASSVYGGVIGYWTAEAATLTASQPKYTQVRLDAKKLTCLARVTNELLRDASGGLAGYLQQALPDAVRFFEDDAFIAGTGAGQPAGITGATCRVAVTKETGQAAATIVTENLDKMFARMLPTSLGRAVWLANIETFPELASMTRAVGTGGSAVFISNVAGGPPNSIYGRPVIFTEKCAALGTEGDIMFVDPAYYLIGDRQQVEATISEHIYFLSDESAFRFIERVDGQPWLSSALTPRRGTATLSPIVTLATRA